MKSNVCFSSYENEELAPVDSFKWREFVVGIKFRTSVTVIEMAVTRWVVIRIAVRWSWKKKIRLNKSHLELSDGGATC